MSRQIHTFGVDARANSAIESPRAACGTQPCETLSSKLSPALLLQSAQRAHAEYFKQVSPLHLDSRSRSADWCYTYFEESAALFAQTYAEQVGLGPVHSSWLADIYYELDCSYAHAVAHVLAAWRATKGVFRFDADLLLALTRTTEMRKLPAASMLRLPHWCVYVDVQRRITWEGLPVEGFYAMLSQESEDCQTPQLVLLLDTGHVQPYFRLPLQGPTLDSALRAAVEANRSANDVRASVLSKAGEHLLERQDANDYSIDIEALSEELPAVLNLLLYMCAENADFGKGQRPLNPSPTKTRKGMKVFPASAVTNWDVGIRVGADLRRAQDAAARPRDHDACALESLEQPRVSTRPRPHIRSAHWHYFWTGPRKPSAGWAEPHETPAAQEGDGGGAGRRLVLRWVMPTLVNAVCSDGIPAVVRNLRGASNDHAPPVRRASKPNIGENRLSPAERDRRYR